MKINFGCGSKKIEGWLNVDLFDSVEPDMILDMEKTPWPFSSNSVDEMLFSHVLEHVGAMPKDFLNIIKEIYRIAKDGCVLNIYVPHPRHEHFIIDPTHCRVILPATMEMFNRDKNLEQIKNKETITPLGFFHDVNIKVQKISYIYGSRVREAQAAGVSEKELQQMIYTELNSIQEIRMSLLVSKEWESA